MQNAWFYRVVNRTIRSLESPLPLINQEVQPKAHDILPLNSSFLPAASPLTSAALPLAWPAVSSAALFAFEALIPAISAALFFTSTNMQSQWSVQLLLGEVFEILDLGNG